MISLTASNMLLKSDGILVKFPFFQGNVGIFFVSVAYNIVAIYWHFIQINLLLVLSYSFIVKLSVF